MFERGHAISSAVGGGVFCRKCGVFVRESKHRRLKISYRHCTQANLPREEWLNAPAFKHNPARLAELLLVLHNRSNGHDLAWNCNTHPTDGIVRCLKCQKTWPWNNRHNLCHRPCRGRCDRERTPDRSISVQMLLQDRRRAFATLASFHLQDSSANRVEAPASTAEPSSAASAGVSSSSPNVQPSGQVRVPSLPAQVIGGARRRIRGKTSLSQPTRTNAAHASGTLEMARNVPVSLDQPLDANVSDLPKVDRIVFDDMG